MNEYKELNLGDTSFEPEDFKIELEGVDTPEEIDKIELEEVSDKKPSKPSDPPSTDDGEEREGEPGASAAKPKKDNHKQSRAQKRIKELLDERAADRERLMAIQEELENYKKISSESTKTSKEQMKKTLEDQALNLNRRLIKAMEEGDTAATVEIQDSLFDVKNQLFSLTTELNNYKPYEPKKVEKVKAQEPKPVPEKALEWIDEYPSFKTDPVFQASALAVNNQLINEGWDDESEDFYIEISNRLSKRFPEVFGTSEGNDVELDENSSNRVGGKTVKKTPRYTEQTVSGASRTPSSTSDGKPINSKRNTITLTPEDQRLAKRFNMTPEQFAKRKLALRNKEQGDYVEIITSA